MLTKCCAEKFDHEGTPSGVIKAYGGLESYIAGDDKSDDKVIIFLSDIFGHKFQNNQLVADNLARVSGLKVVIPDILNNDGYDPNADYSGLGEWLKSHAPPLTEPIVEGFFTEVIAEFKPSKLFAIGYCFGAFFVLPRLKDTGVLTAGAVAHPSVRESTLYKEVRKPLLISVGSEDAACDADLRKEINDILTTNKVRFQLDVFSNAPHGYAIRGDLKVPEVKYAKEKTLLDQVHFFEAFI